MTISSDREPVVTRPATIADFEFMWDVQLQALGAYVSEQFGTSIEEQREFFDRHIRVEAHQIVEMAGRPIGFLFYEERHNEVYLGNLAILPRYQGRGVGTLLARRVVAVANASGHPVVLQVLKPNVGAQRLYQRLGFAEVGETDSHIVMRHEPPP